MNLIPGLGELEYKLEESMLVMEKILTEMRRTNDLLIQILQEQAITNEWLGGMS